MVIREAGSEADRRAVQDLLREGFEVRPGVGDAFAQLYCDVENARSLVAVVDEVVVGHVLLALRTFMIGGVQIPGGILAMVVVAPHCRGQGIGGALIQEAERMAHNAGALLLQLAGDPRFYMRFGFVPAYVRARAVVDRVEAHSGKCMLRSANVNDLADLVVLSNLDVSSGAVCATEDRWRWVLNTRYPKSLLMHNDRFFGFCAQGDDCLIESEFGFVRGCWNGDILAIYEAASVDDVSAEDLFTKVGLWAHDLGCSQIAFHLPSNNDLMLAAIDHGASYKVWEENELQIKLIDIPGILSHCQDLFARRAQAAAFDGVLKMRVGEQSFVLDFGATDDQSPRYEVYLPEIGLARALLGTDCLSDRLGMQSARMPGSLLDALFSQKDPYFWLADTL